MTLAHLHDGASQRGRHWPVTVMLMQRAEEQEQRQQEEEYVHTRSLLQLDLNRDALERLLVLSGGG